MTNIQFFPFPNNDEDFFFQKMKRSTKKHLELCIIRNINFKPNTHHLPIRPYLAVNEFLTQ